MFGKYPFGWSWFGFGQEQDEDEEEPQPETAPAMVVGTIYLDSRWPVTVFARPQLLVLRAGVARATGQARAATREKSAGAFMPLHRPSRATARGSARAVTCGRSLQMICSSRINARGAATVRTLRQPITLTCSQARSIGIRNPTEDELIATLLVLEEVEV